MSLGDTFRVYGIDPWKSAIERTKQKLEQYEIKNVELIEVVIKRVQNV